MADPEITLGSGAVGGARRSREELRDAIDRLEAAVSAPVGDAPAWWQGTTTALGQVRYALTSQIVATEAPDGLFQEISEEAPRLVHDMELLRRENDELLDRLDELDRQAASAASPAEGREQAVSLLDALVRHRQRGAELVYEAFNGELGGPD